MPPRCGLVGLRQVDGMTPNAGLFSGRWAMPHLGTKLHILLSSASSIWSSLRICSRINL